jgi:hypothetical protein
MLSALRRNCVIQPRFPTTCELSALVSNSSMAVDLFRPVFAAAAAVQVGAAVAHADSADDQFLGLLSNDGLSVGPPDQMIAIAHQRCYASGQLVLFSLRRPTKPVPGRHIEDRR